MPTRTRIIISSFYPLLIPFPRSDGPLIFCAECRGQTDFIFRRREIIFIELVAFRFHRIYRLLFPSSNFFLTDNFILILIRIYSTRIRLRVTSTVASLQVPTDSIFQFALRYSRRPARTSRRQFYIRLFKYLGWPQILVRRYATYG